mmetsp:Transcript_72651/g.170910  ORF Transcript_72651/g.170910 Transcript_72651/m.170910 type:complete len:133 (+) Transcript_72651:460-858(+)
MSRLYILLRFGSGWDRLLRMRINKVTVMNMNNSKSSSLQGGLKCLGRSWMTRRQSVDLKSESRRLARAPTWLSMWDLKATQPLDSVPDSASFCIIKWTIVLQSVSREFGTLPDNDDAALHEVHTWMQECTRR